MTNYQQIYDALHQAQDELITACNAHPQRGSPALKTEAMAQQIVYLTGAVSLMLKALGAKDNE